MAAALSLQIRLTVGRCYQQQAKISLAVLPLSLLDRSSRDRTALEWLSLYRGVCAVTKVCTSLDLVPHRGSACCSLNGRWQAEKPACGQIGRCSVEARATLSTGVHQEERRTCRRTATGRQPSSRDQVRHPSHTILTARAVIYATIGYSMEWINLVNIHNEVR